MCMRTCRDAYTNIYIDKVRILINIVKIILLDSQDWHRVESLQQLDSQPANVRINELETVVDELQSELEVKSKEMNTLKNENKVIMDKYVQLKQKHDLKEDDSVKGNYDLIEDDSVKRKDDSIMLPQPTVLDSLEHNLEVHKHQYNYIIIGKY